MLGDFLDFPRVIGANSKSGSSTDTIDKVRRIGAGHSALFNAMQRLIEAGHGIDILPGNHDPQLMNAAVQSELTRLLDTGGSNQIRVHNWLLHVPGVFFAEHGNQYHDINSFPNWLRFAAPDGPSPDLPIGPVFDDFIVGLAQRTGQTSLNMNTILARISRSPALALKTLPANIGFAAHMISNVLGIAGGRGKTSRGAYRETLLPEESKRCGLPIDVLAAIDRLAEEIARELPGRLANALRQIPARIMPFMPTRRDRGSGGVLSSPAQRSARIRQIAAQIDDVLRESSLEVPFYVFGHTHRAVDELIRGAGNGTRYLNTGSWTGEHSPVANARPVLSYVLIHSGVESELPRASLMAWNAIQNRPEALPQS